MTLKSFATICATLSLLIPVVCDNQACLAVPEKIESTAMLKVGDRAPDFELASASGKNVSLKEFTGKKNVVVFFYPKDNTSVCTAEACAFRDAYEDFLKEDAEVIGISSDSSESHQGFADKHKLPFVLLSDPGEKTRRAYKVPKSLGMIPGRVTFVIDKQGVVRHVFNSQMDSKKHVTEAMRILATLK